MVEELRGVLQSQHRGRLKEVNNIILQGCGHDFPRGFVNSSSTRQLSDEPLHEVSTCTSWFRHGVDAVGDLGALIW